MAMATGKRFFEQHRHSIQIDLSPQIVFFQSKKLKQNDLIEKYGKNLEK
jgi:hypothetical protein